MTLPRERSKAIRNTREFLRSLLQPKETPRVPKTVRTAAYWCLRHFPFDYEINRAAVTNPEIFGELPDENESALSVPRRKDTQSGETKE